jgi:hypothetical protein
MAPRSRSSRFDFAAVRYRAETASYVVRRAAVPVLAELLLALRVENLTPT